MVEEEPRKLSLWLFKWLKTGLDALTVPFDNMYTIPICIWSYKESANSLNADICISSYKSLTRSNPNNFPDLHWLPYSCMFVLAITWTWMFQTLPKYESDVNGIVDAAKEGFSFIELGFTATEELICEVPHKPSNHA